MARYMPDFGWQPTVLAPNSVGSIVHGIPEEKIIRIGHHRQNSVSYEDKNQSGGWSRMGHPFYRAAKKWRLTLRSMDTSVFHWGRSVWAERNQVLKLLPPVQCVVSVFGPAAPHWLGRYFSKQLQAPWVADFRDLCALYPEHRSRLTMPLDVFIERFMTKRAAGFTTVSPSLKKIMARTFKIKGTIIYNGWDGSQLGTEEETEPPVSKNEPLSIYYGGRLYPHQLQSLDLLFRCLKQNPRFRLVLQTLGPPELEAEVRSLLAQRNLQDQVSFRKPEPPHRAAKRARTASINLVTSDLNGTHEWSKGVLSGKLMELLGIKPPILCIARPDSDIGPILQSTEKGRLCSSSEEIDAFLKSAALDNGLYCGNEEEVARFSRRAQAKQFCAFLDQITEESR